MSFTFRPAKREGVPLLIGLAGGTGSGKTMSALELAKGMAGSTRFAVIDTENGRASMYADEFDFDVSDLDAPFRPARYADAIQAAADAGYEVIVVDSMSHEWAGDGGMLDWQEEEMRGDEKRKLTAWIEPKKAHRKMVTRLLQVPAHVILCFRAQEKVEVTRDEGGRMQIVAKRSLTGLDGWIPIAEKSLPFELTLSVLLMADRPGVPHPIKVPEKLRPFFPPDAPITAAAGAELAAWAKGAAPKIDPELDALAAELRDLVTKLGATDSLPSVEAHRASADKTWLRKQIKRSKDAIAAREADPAGQSTFKIPETARR